VKKTRVAITILAFAVTGIIATATFASAVPQPNIHDTILSIVQSIQSTVTSTDQKIDNLSTSPVCPADKVQHWYTLTVYHTNSNMELRSPTHPTILANQGHWLNIKASSDDLFDHEKLVIDKLIELGYVAYNTDTDISSPLSYADTWINIQLFSGAQSSHSTICAES